MSKPIPRHERFVAEYLVDPNASRAAKRAGYAPGSANQAARRLMQIPEVKTAIEAGTVGLLDRLEVKAEEVVRQAARVVFADLTSLFDAEGKPKDLGELDAETLALFDMTLSYDKEGRHTATHLRQLDRMQALVLLGKYFKLFSDRIEQTGGRDISRAIAAARDRAP